MKSAFCVEAVFCFTFQIYCSKCIIVNGCHSVMNAFMLSRLKCEELKMATYCMLMFASNICSYHVCNI